MPISYAEYKVLNRRGTLTLEEKCLIAEYDSAKDRRPEVSYGVLRCVACELNDGYEHVGKSLIEQKFEGRDYQMPPRLKGRTFEVFAVYSRGNKVSAIAMPG